VKPKLMLSGSIRRPTSLAEVRRFECTWPTISQFHADVGLARGSRAVEHEVADMAHTSLGADHHQLIPESGQRRVEGADRGNIAPSPRTGSTPEAHDRDRF
jgi:hypothetical protein